MAENNYRKPIPKTQREISVDLQTPYSSEYGNPNDAVSGDQYPPNNEANIPFNRSEKLSWRDEDIKPFSIGIKDIDESIMYYFENVIKPSVTQNGERIPVPIIYGSPERWKSVQKDGYYRDKKGAIMLPILMYKRDTIEKNRSLGRKLDSNYPNLYVYQQKSFNEKNTYSNFNLLNNRIPTQQYIATVIPEWVNITYSCVVQTYYVEQLNKIIEAINYASDSYWGDPARFKFRARIDSFQTITELQQSQERLVKSTFTIKLYGYMVPDTVQKDITAIKKVNSKAKLIFQLESNAPAERFEANPLSTPDGRSIDQPGSGGGPVNFANTPIVSPSNSLNLNNLSSTEPTVPGTLWISGSSPNHPNSGHLMIYNP